MLLAQHKAELGVKRVKSIMLFRDNGDYTPGEPSTYPAPSIVFILENVPAEGLDRHADESSKAQAGSDKKGGKRPNPFGGSGRPSPNVAASG